MINWLLQRIEAYQSVLDVQIPDSRQYLEGRIEAYKECLEYIEKASRKEKINE